jgi:RNA polymerase sigma factor (sigma-70 family)
MNTTKYFFQDLKNLNLESLTKEEEKEIFSNLTQQNITKLYGSCAKYVIKMAKRYSNRGIPLDELIQSGSEGLLIAINKFKPEMGNRFLTFATSQIFCEIIMLFRRANKGQKKEKDKGSVSFSSKTLSIDFIDNSGNMNLSDVIVDERINLEKETVDNDNLNRILNCLKQFSNNEQYVIINSFGLYGKEKNLKEIAKELKISPQRVHQIRKRTINRLQQLMGV